MLLMDGIAASTSIILWLAILVIAQRLKNRCANSRLVPVKFLCDGDI